MQLSQELHTEVQQIEVPKLYIFSFPNERLKVLNTQQSRVVCWLVAYCPSNMLVYLRDRSAQTSLHAATLRQKLHIKLSTSPSHRILTLGQPIPTQTLKCQVPGRVTTGVLMFKLLV